MVPAAYLTQKSRSCRIGRGGLEGRRSPKTGGVVKNLTRGTNVEIADEETWLHVKTRDGKEGFVLADFIETVAQDLFPSNGEATNRQRSDHLRRRRLRKTLEFGTPAERS